MTVALRSRANGLLARTEVAHVTPFFTDFDRHNDGFMANDDDRNVHYLNDEGITWVRGHVADDSLEGKALIAAHALAPKLDIGFTASAFVTASSVFHVTLTGLWSTCSSPNPTLSIGNNPNPKNELGE